VQRAPGIPHALCFLGEKFMHDPGASRRGNAESRDVSTRRPCERRDPSPLDSKVKKALCSNARTRRHGVWVPAFAGTTRGKLVRGHERINTRRVFSSKIKVRVIGGSVMDLRFRRARRDQAGVISALALIRMQSTGAITLAM
jgi:hypothetical protein